MALKLPKIIKDDGVEKMLSQINTKCTIGARNYAIIMIMWRCALRVQEVCDLMLADADLETGSVYVQQGKGKKDRYTYMDKETTEAVQDWLKVRPESTFLFCTMQGGQLQQRYIREMCYRISKKAGVYIQDGRKKRPVNPHVFRHTCLTNLLQKEGFSIREVQEIAGHSDLSTTQVYLHVDNQELAAKMRNR
jgi:site-specific recombinase XerD